jgi:hypothetical protein
MQPSLSSFRLPFFVYLYRDYPRVFKELAPIDKPRLSKWDAVHITPCCRKGEERNFPLGEILPKAKFLCSPLAFTAKLTIATISPVADTLRYPPMSKITFQKIIFPENRTNNSTYRHQKQSKSWGGEIRRSRGDLPTISGIPPERKSKCLAS